MDLFIVVISEKVHSFLPEQKSACSNFDREGMSTLPHSPAQDTAAAAAVDAGDTDGENYVYHERRPPLPPPRGGEW